MLPKPSQYSRSCSLSMESLKQSDLTMAHNLPAINLLNLLRSGTLITPSAPHTTRNPRSNGQGEVAVKVTKGLLTNAKYSGQDPYLALLAYRSTPIDAHLHSPTKMLYPRVTQNHCALKDQAQGPPSCSWPWSPQQLCHPECCIPWLSLQAEAPTICRTSCFHAQWCQDPLAPSHSHPSSKPWFILGSSYWRRTVQMCMWPHLWHIYHYWCSPSYTWVLTWNAPNETSTSSPSHCTCCSSNNPTKPSCSCNYTKHSKEN